MSKLSSVVVLALAGCPAAPRYLVVNVRSGERPVADALVVVSCDAPLLYASRADRAGVAELSVSDGLDPQRCSVLAAQPGYRTARSRAVAPCDRPAACQALRVQLDPLGGPAAPAPTVIAPAGEGR